MRYNATVNRYSMAQGRSHAPPGTYRPDSFIWDHTVLYTASSPELLHAVDVFGLGMRSALVQLNREVDCFLLTKSTFTMMAQKPRPVTPEPS